MQLSPASTALVLIDLQQGIVASETQPRPSSEVVNTAKSLASRFREAGAPVVLVHVAFGPDDGPSTNVDQPSLPDGGTPAGFETLVDGLRAEGDAVVLKHHWGAFTGTDLDLQLRRRGVKTIVLAGIATNKGVESTARSAWELSYDVVIVEDACAAAAAEEHRYPVETIFPQLARVVTSADVSFS